MLLKVDLRQNDAFLFLECQLRGRVHLGGGHGTITVVCLIPCVHLCLIAWYHYQIQVCLRVHIWKWWKGKWNIQSRRLFCGILHLAAEQCWASVLKLWIIYKQKYLQRSVDAHVGVTARNTLLMEVRGCHCECACEIGRRDQSKEFKMWIVWISKGLHERLWCPACSYMTLCLWHDIHYGTGMSHNGFGCLHFSMCLHTCVFDCVHSSSKFSSLCGALQCPLLIHSQNGCCQAEKLPSRVLMGLNRKLSSVGFIELIAYMSGVILFS